MTISANIPDQLLKGYRRFRERDFERQQATWKSLAEGQSPQIMIISCCDSRVDPTVVFDAAPGDLFVVRNVANLVPPFEPHGTYHGTSAALEFAVDGLRVQHIVVMGHAQCGGIAAWLNDDYGGRPEGFIARWMSIIQGARGYLPSDAPEAGPEGQRAMEHASILNSIDNLISFPFIRDAMNEERLQIHGMHFGIANGVLEVVDPSTGESAPVDV